MHASGIGPSAFNSTMTFPATREALTTAGYTFEFSRPCKRCEANLEFFKTPTGAFAPLEVVVIEGQWLMDSHFKTCPYRDEFKKPAAAVEAKPAGATPQGDLFGGKR